MTSTKRLPSRCSAKESCCDRRLARHRWQLSLGNLDVEFGGTIQDAQLTWQARGTLNDARDNVIVYPPRTNHEADDLHYYFGFGLAGSEEPRHRASQSGTLGRNRPIDDEVRSHWRLG